MVSAGGFQFDEAHFLAHYWQQRPLLIPNALPGFRSPLSPEELAGLACEPEIESRIVGYREGVWSLADGPFQAQDFQRDDLWTLLVQGVDRWVPEVAALRQAVSFLPNWRFDDIMVSYAVDGGSVGPHFDRYDVFLLQGEGERLWRLGGLCDEHTPRIDHERLHLLESFTTLQEFLLKPGDVLYVPPGVAHWGVAAGACMTYSLGFRAPAVGHMMARLTDEVLDTIDPLLLLQDQSSVLNPGRPGELTQAHIDNARSAVLNAMTALDSGSWLAELLTEGASDEVLDEPISMVLPGQVMLTPDARVVWIDRQDDSERDAGAANAEAANSVQVFAGGDCHWTSPAMIVTLERLCSGGTLEPDAHNEVQAALLDFLLEMGVLMNEE